jgi:hypothetical protein
MAKRSAVSTLMVASVAGASVLSQVAAGFDLPLFVQLMFLLAASVTMGAATWWTVDGSVAIKKNLQTNLTSVSRNSKHF